MNKSEIEAIAFRISKLKEIIGNTLHECDINDSQSVKITIDHIYVINEYIGLLTDKLRVIGEQ